MHAEKSLLHTWEVCNKSIRQRERIAEGLNAAETARSEAAEAQANVQAQLDAARGEGQEIVANAQSIATRLQAEAREQSERDREVAAERARVEIQQERDRAIADLRREFAGITITAAEKGIGQALDQQGHEGIIDETLDQSSFGEN